MQKILSLNAQGNQSEFSCIAISYIILFFSHLIFKDKVEFWSCDCIVKETVWNLSGKVDHLVYKYSCVLQGSGIIKMIRNLAKSWQNFNHCTQNDVYGTTRAHGEKTYPPIFTMFHVIFRI